MFTQFDIIVSFIALLFMTMGLFKGAIRSILGLGKWYGSGVLTLLFYPHARDIVAQYIQPGMIVNGIAVVLTYIIVLITLSILIGIFVKALGGTVGGPGDKLLGAIVGFTIGGIIASTAHYFIRSFAGGSDPGWLRDGKTYEMTSKGSDILQTYFKDVVNKMGTDMGFATMDPTGGLMDKIKQYQTQTGSDVDMDKLKEAIRMMKGEGMNPSQIKDMINVQDYTMPGTGNSGVSINQGQAQQGIAQMLNGDPNGLSKITNGIGAGGIGGIGHTTGPGVTAGDDYYDNLKTYKGPGSSSGGN